MIALRDSDSHDLTRVHLLTEAQRACLRGVLAHLTSREIAREIGISPHTVDGHLRAAIQRLGVSSRTEAALLLAAVEGTYPRWQAREASRDAAFVGSPGLSHGLAEVDSGPYRDVDYTELVGTEDEQGRNIAYTSGCQETVLLAHQGEGVVADTKFSRFRTIGKNELSPAWRLLIVMLVSLGSAVMFAALVFGLSSLSQLR
jgi:DNA-binding CsgD family transcriptional regulator